MSGNSVKQSTPYRHLDLYSTRSQVFEEFTDCELKINEPRLGLVTALIW